MADARGEEYVDVEESLGDDSEAEQDEEFQDAVEDLLRQSQAAKDSQGHMVDLESDLQRLNTGGPSTKDSETPEALLNQALNDEEDSQSENDDPVNDDVDDDENDDSAALLEERKKREEAMTEEEIVKLKSESQSLKEEGNTLFRNSDFAGAIQCYTKALDTCPLQFSKDRSVMYSNRAACMMHMNDNTAGIEDSTKAIELNPNYLKAILRRAELYERTEKLDEALADYQKVLELDPRMHHAREACLRLPKQIEERNEKMKEEMMGKLKDLGNMILRPFGLSTNNFKLQQDPNTGGYSVSFQQNPAAQSQPPEPTHFPQENPQGGSANANPPGGGGDS